MSHDLTNEYGGEGNMGWVRVTCSCGWRGIQHFAYNDTQYSDAGREWARHCDEAAKASFISKDQQSALGEKGGDDHA